MTALADALRALRPFAHPSYPGHEVARDVLRKHAPCDGCDGEGLIRDPTQVYCSSGAQRRITCDDCRGEGWTPDSVEAACARTDEREAYVKRLEDPSY